jgi:hypothetical protein
MPAEIQATFFNGKPFTAASPSGVKFKMTFTADGKAKRVPAGKGGARNEGARRHGHVEQVNADKQGQRTIMYSKEATNAPVMPTAVSLVDERADCESPQTRRRGGRGGWSDARIRGIKAS